jgi:predicted anti-sigma-YlaC factor YlaD
MRLISFYDWIRRIYATHDDELDCDQLLELLPSYVDVEIAGEVTPSHLCEVERHLRQCPYCYDIYLGLRDAARVESQQAVLEEVPVERCQDH